MKFLFCLLMGAMTARIWFRVLANTSSHSTLIGNKSV